MKSFVAQSAIGALLLAQSPRWRSAAAALPGSGPVPSSPSAPLPAAAPEIQPSEVFAYERFGKVSVYRPHGEPREVVLFLSGDGGWTLGVLSMTQRLVEQGALVAGIDNSHYLAELERAKENACLRRWISRI